MSTKHIRHGLGSVRPYLYGDLDLPDFVSYVFGSVEVERVEMGEKSVHVEARIGDSVLVIEAGQLLGDVSPWTSALHVYVPDVDATYSRAMERGATPLAAPENKPYQERLGGFKDGAGNTWWLSTYLG
jgi:PhnB protein